MNKGSLKLHQESAGHRGASPWSLGDRIKMITWEYTWLALCVWTPKPFNAWRLMILRLFGEQTSGRPFLHQRTRIQIPWNVELRDGACTGDRTNLYSLDRITLEEGCVVAQEAYLCTGTHDFSHPSYPLVTAPITVGKSAFIGARAFILPGVRIGDQAIVGACALITGDIPERAIYGGNPGRPLNKH